ncbi:hypothetical protein FUA23_09150 [Neolewinella aurantiaca]|uniref:Uncharacterized protein n=1 Tax=Neolewinella aurantiaca TaxID=2602767 RepID=A0A5C7FIZ6_9BACT|nr:hypothetical protein [Neolewinella aurantiaca]TXF89841.1 hypothetical protein FUA23_09150 [Neolewinella aurantiaca]
MQILTVVIGIIFVLLLLSLLATTLMELLSSFFSLRSRNLIKALRNMLASSDENEILVQEFQNNSLYRHLTQQYGRQGSSSTSGPSYMSAETFQSILFDVILKGEGTDQLKSRIESLPDADLRNVLSQLLRESDGQLDLFRLEVQNWYNNVMDRAAGWYKRYTQKILLFMGLGIAVVFNADTVALYDRLSNDPETLTQLVAAAEQYVQARDKAGPIETTPGSGQDINTPASVPGPGFDSQTTVNPYDSAAAVPVGGPAPSTDYQPSAPAPATYLYSGEDVAEQDFRESLEDLKGLLNNEIAEIRRPLGMGWEGVSLRELSTFDLVTKVLGFILTALAISMGAPFWFDLLKKLVNIRSSGSRPYEN